MKNNLVLIAALVMTLIGCGQKGEGVKVEGKVENPVKNALVLLNRYEPTGFVTIDTVDVDPSGAFSFYVKVEKPTFYRLNFYNKQMLNLILDGQEEDVEIMLEGNNPAGEVSVKGSTHTGYLQQLEGMMKDQQQDIQGLNQQVLEARMSGDQQTIDRVTEEYYDLMEVRQKEMKKYLWTIAPSLATFYGLESIPLEENFPFYDSLATKYEAELPDDFMAAELIKRVKENRKLAIGMPAPEIALPTPDGDTITLSALRGKYVMIDFWAAWCKPCRAENPNVVKMYQKYAGDKFEILGVSLDRNKEAWVQAIADDGLVWKQVSDLKYFNCEAAADYQIRAIPATYLIDPDGKILAKNLRGPSLEAKLEELFAE